MGVDYTPRFGIGYKIAEKVFENEDNCMDKYLDDLCKYKFKHFETGYGCYTGEKNEYYVVLKNPFEKTLDLTEQKDELYNFLTDNGIEIIEDFGLQGGLQVW